MYISIACSSPGKYPPVNLIHEHVFSDDVYLQILIQSHPFGLLQTGSYGAEKILRSHVYILTDLINIHNVYIVGIYIWSNV